MSNSESATLASTATPTATQKPPRFFLRRLLAFLVDGALASWCTALFLSLLPLPDWADPGQPVIGLRWSTCADYPADKAPFELAVTPPAPVDLVKWCRVSALIGPDRFFVTIIYDTTPFGPSTRFKFMTYRTDATGKPVNPVDIGIPSTLLLLGLASGWIGRAGKRTPGKTLARLGITGSPGFRREALRLGPLLVLLLLVMAPAAVPPGLLPPFLTLPFGVILATSFAPLLLVWVWYDLYPLRWRGALRHDRLCGTAVTDAATWRANRNRSPA